jgi:hypothetical protein
MRRHKRDIEIFSMSVLDMFASALGAFILCAIILFPYYKKDQSQARAAVDAALEEKTKELEQAKGELLALAARAREPEQNVRQAAESETTLRQCRKNMQDCAALLAKTFLLVQIDWQETIGVDLQITDARGNAFTWFKTNRTGRDFPNSKAFLSIVVQTGPGIAYWIEPSASPGTYQIDYTMQRPPDRDVNVAGFVFSHAGKLALPTRTLRGGQSRIHAGTITIADDGGVTLR